MKKPKINMKKLLIVQFLIIGILLVGLAQYAFAPMGTNVTISQGVYPGAPSYTIWREGSTYYAKDDMGAIDYSGTNATTVTQNAINAIGSNNGTVILIDVPLSPSDVTYGNNVILLNQDGTSLYEEWVYKLFVALTTPSYQQLQIGTFSFTPSAGVPVYSVFKGLVRYGGLAVNYVDLHSLTSPFSFMVTRHDSTEGAITGQSASSNFWYVNQTIIDSIDNAKALWERRLYWLLTTSPTRVVVDNVASETSANTTVTVGTYGSLVRHAFWSTYQMDITFDISGTIRNAFVNPWTVQSRNSANYTHTVGNSEIFMPLTTSASGNTISSWTLRVWGSNAGLGWTAYAIIEKYDLPSWWEP